MSTGCTDSGMSQRFSSGPSLWSQNPPPLPLLEDRDLAGVIERVLHRTVQHEVEVVVLAGNACVQPLVRHAEDSGVQLAMRFFQGTQRGLPLGVAEARHARPVLVVGKRN